MKFTLKIESDNDDNGPEMVAECLEEVAALLDNGRTTGTLRDRNGNAVGSWNMEEGS
jgi:hypothetical protein